MIGKNITSLSQLVTKYEDNQIELTQVPQEFVDRYGYACLANSLMFKEPKIPKYDIKIAEHMKRVKFKTLQSLVTYIEQLDNDIDKLFAIFSYAALNIEYDVKLCFSGVTRSTTIDEVFQTKKAVCSGYAIFFEGMAQKVGIDSKRIKICGYSNFSKAQSYDPLNRPKEIKSNHASIYVTIDNVPFICEPTWASGQLTKKREFERNFRPNLFLIPFFKTLCDHYPCEESKEMLKINFPFSHFFQAIKIDPFGRQIKTESNPFVNITSSTGYVEQIYSCIAPIDSVSLNLSIRKDNGFCEISSCGLTSYEIMQMKLKKHQNRCRFKTFILFPEIGFYKVDMFIDGKSVLYYFVDNLKKSAGSIPIQYNPFHQSKFIAIRPKNIHSNVETGAIIRFAVSKYHSNIRLKILKLENDNNFIEKGKLIDTCCSKYIKLEIPFDDERYEIQLCVMFPSNGRFCVSVFLENTKGSFVLYVKYFFDVVGVEYGNAYKDHPVYYMCKERKFAPVRIFDKKKEVIIKPNQSCHVVNKREQILQIKTHSIDDKLYFEFKKNGKTVVWPKVSDIDDEFRTVNFVIPEEHGEYSLKGWINDNCCIDLLYIYNDIVFKESTIEERQLLDELKNRIIQEKPKINKMIDNIIRNAQIKKVDDTKKVENNKNSNIDVVTKKDLENNEKNSKQVEKPKPINNNNNENEKNKIENSEIEKLMKIIENLKKENENSVHEIEKLKDEIEHFKSENKKQNSFSPENHKEFNNEKLNEHNEIQNPDKNLIITNEKTIEKTELNTKLIELEEKNEQLMKKNEILIVENQNLQTLNDEKAKEIEQLKVENAELKKNNEKLMHEDKKLKINIDEKTKEEIEKLKIKIDDLKNHNDKLKEENEISILKNEKSKNINEKSKERIEQLTKENEKIKIEYKNSYTEIEKLKKENEKSIIENDDKLQTIKEENEKLKQDNEKLNKENELLKKEIEKIKEKEAKNSTNTNEKSKLINSAEHENDKIKTKLSSTSKSTPKVENKVSTTTKDKSINETPKSKNSIAQTPKKSITITPKSDNEMPQNSKQTDERSKRKSSSSILQTPQKENSKSNPENENSSNIQKVDNGKANQKIPTKNQEHFKPNQTSSSKISSLIQNKPEVDKKKLNSTTPNPKITNSSNLHFKTSKSSIQTPNYKKTNSCITPNKSSKKKTENTKNASLNEKNQQHSNNICSSKSKTENQNSKKSRPIPRILNSPI